MILTPFAECAAPKKKRAELHWRCWTLFNSYDFGQRFFAKVLALLMIIPSFGGRNRIRVPRQDVPVGRTKKADAYLSYSLIVRTCNGVATKYGYVRKRQIFPNQSPKRKLSYFRQVQGVWWWYAKNLPIFCISKGYVKIFQMITKIQDIANLTSVGE